VGHACVTTGRRSFSMPSFFQDAQLTPHVKQASWSGNQHSSFSDKKYEIHIKNNTYYLQKEKNSIMIVSY